MEDKKPQNPNDLLVFQNIDNEDFEWYYDKMKTPLPYYIRAGEKRELPYFIAWHGIYHLINRILMKQNKLPSNPIFRAELLEKIVLGIKHINYIREKTPNEIALEEMQRKKETDPVQELLKKRDIENERIEAQKLAAMQPKAPLIETRGTPTPPPVTDSTSIPDAPSTPAVHEDPPLPPEADPARMEFYHLLTSELHMDLAHMPTKQKLDATPLDDLKKEFASQLPSLGIAVAPEAPRGIHAPTVNSQPYTPPVERPSASVLDAAMPPAV